MSQVKLVRAVLIVSCVVGASHLDAAAADLVEPAKIEALVQPLVDGDWITGAAIGLIDESGTQFAGYGRMSDADPAAPSADTLFEIGSISKTFTGLILAQMAEDGTVKLDDPVQKLLGDSITMPLRERDITLVDLATHASGLPRLPSNLKPADVANPYADYTVEQMASFLAAHKLTRPPGKQSEYSNLGVGLLGHALALKSGTSYEELLNKTICQPLAMPDTVITLSEAQQKRLAAPHDCDGQLASNWDIPTLAGAGAIRSTVTDLLKYLAAQMQLTDTPLAAAIRRSHDVHFAGGEDAANDLALAWHLHREPKMIWHNGGTGGYHSFAAFSPETKQGVVLLVNTSSAYADALGNQLFALLTTGEAKPVDLPTTIELTADELEPLVGQYELAPQLVAKVTRDDARLYVQLSGQPRIGLYPETKTHFYCRPVKASFDFETGDDGQVARMVIHQNGLNIPGKRVE